MARFYGPVGISQQVEEPADSGIWVEQVIELNFFGDINRNARRSENQDQANDSVVLENTISIVVDHSAIEQLLYDIRYVVWVGKRWKVDSVEIQPPRLLLRLGSVYNGITPPTP